MKRIRFTLLCLLVAGVAAACDATQITTANSPPPPACGDGPTMGSGC